MARKKNEISIPFNFTKPEDILSGRKTATRRATAYGAKSGDILLANKIGSFRITAVYRQQLGDMTEEDAKKYYDEASDALEKLKSYCVNSILNKPFNPEILIEILNDLVVDPKKICT